MSDSSAESVVVIRVASMRMADPDLPLEDRIHFLKEMAMHGRRIAEYAQAKLDSINQTAMDAVGEGDDTLHVFDPLDPLQ